MKRGATTSFVVLVLFFGGVFPALNVAMGQTADISYVIKMSVTYSNRSNENQIWNFTEREGDRTISLFMNNTWQTVQLTNSSFSVETEETDMDGNSVAVLEFPVTALKRGESLTFNSTYHVVSKPRPLPPITEGGSGVLRDVPLDLRDRYTKEEGPWLVSDLGLRDLARKIVEGEEKVLTIVKKLVLWVHNNIAYQTHEVPYYANETLNERKGDCDDQAVLFITMSRILGIPAHLQVGAVYMPTIERDESTYWRDHVTDVAKRIGWHGWAMVYVPPWGWLPVDLTFAEGAIADPLKAITNAAVTSQIVVQYMNVTKSDYVASSRQARDFLIANRFYVYMEDEMIAEAGQQNLFGEGFEELLPWILIACLVVGAVVAVTSSLLISLRLTKRWTKEKTPKPQQ